MATESVSTIPEFLKPYLENTLQEGQDLYGAGAFSNVEGLTDEQKEGLALLKGSAMGTADTANKSAEARDIMLNSARGGNVVSYDGNNNDLQAMKDSAIRKSQQAFGDTAGAMASSGLIGGRRAELVKAQRDAELTSNLASIDYNDYNTRRSQALTSASGVIGAGADIQNQYQTPGKTLTSVGQGLQEQQQREADAPYQGFQRWLGALQGVPSSPNSIVSGGK